jgi:beta-lactamase class A
VKQHLITAAVAAVLFLVGLFAGMTFSGEDKPSLPAALTSRSELSETRVSGTFKFISPLLECDNSLPGGRTSIKNMEVALKAYVASVSHTEQVEHVSVYYRDLYNGPWMGIDIAHPFSPASLLKVPVMIAALKKVEEDRSLLKRKFKFDASVPADYVDPNILDEVIQFGHSYTYEDLIHRMVVNSDNNAKNVLVGVLGDDAIFNVWRDLGVAVPDASAPEDFLTVREYSSFFRILYNATYLNKEMSELALEILSRSHFDYGLQAGLPAGIVLSNKFGERGFSDSNKKQLHDCGIVYAKNSPYMLCVMTKGSDWSAQSNVIGEVSRIVYEAHNTK